MIHFTAEQEKRGLIRVDSEKGKQLGLTTEQFTEFLNKVQADVAAEYGIELPQPDDLRLAEIAEMYGL